MEHSDLRQGIDGLAATVQGSLLQDPYSRSLFLFCGRRRNRIKGLLWEEDGFLLLYKRLDNGVFRWPRTETEARLLTEQEVRCLLKGLKLEQPKAINPGETRTFVRVEGRAVGLYRQRKPSEVIRRLVKRTIVGILYHLFRYRENELKFNSLNALGRRRHFHFSVKLHGNEDDYSSPQSSPNLNRPQWH